MGDEHGLYMPPIAKSFECWLSCGVTLISKLAYPFRCERLSLGMDSGPAWQKETRVCTGGEVHASLRYSKAKVPMFKRQNQPFLVEKGEEGTKTAAADLETQTQTSKQVQGG